MKLYSLLSHLIFYFGNISSISATFQMGFYIYRKKHVIFGLKTPAMVGLETSLVAKIFKTEPNLA